jgi:hypothetical protein
VCHMASMTDYSENLVALGIEPGTSQELAEDCLILSLSLDSNIRLSAWAPLAMRHTSSTVAPPLEYAVQELNGSCSLRRRTPNTGNSSTDDYTPGLSINSNNYILPQFLCRLSSLDSQNPPSPKVIKAHDDLYLCNC